MEWTIEDSKLVYGIGRSDLDFLDIDSDGNLELHINGQIIKFKEIIEKIKIKKYGTTSKKLPSFTLRLPQLIKKQISKILQEFNDEIITQQFEGKFRPLYPIKVNQRKREVHAVLKSNKHYGLEAGTKSELILILKVFRQQKHRLIMCNGVKDQDYVQIVKNAIDEGYNIYISIESLTELKHVMKYLSKDNLKLILRIKPYVNLSGYWGSSSGRNSKFGLSIDDLLSVLDILTEHGLRNKLLGVHAHPGSQVEDREDFLKYFNFLIDIYLEIYDLGFSNMEVINFGGGLPIDYDGWLREDHTHVYAETMIKQIIQKCEEKKIVHPNIMIEAGRAITALSSIVVIQPLEYHPIFPRISASEKQAIFEKYLNQNQISEVAEIIRLWDSWREFPKSKALEDIRSYEKKAAVIKEYLRKEFIALPNYSKYLDHPIIKDLFTVDHFLLGNFSIFNSACDYVMIDQYFPVFPISDLNLQPERLIRLVDITCDSDGEISIFRTKPHHKVLTTSNGYPLTSNRKLEWKGFPVANTDHILDTYVIISLVGAYQDIIEFDHNLIGDLPDVELKLTKDDWHIKIIEHAEDIQALVKQVGYIIKNQDNPYIYTESDE